MHAGRLGRRLLRCVREVQGNSRRYACPCESRWRFGTASGTWVGGAAAWPRCNMAKMRHRQGQRRWRQRGKAPADSHKPLDGASACWQATSSPRPQVSAKKGEGLAGLHPRHARGKHARTRDGEALGPLSRAGCPLASQQARSSLTNVCTRADQDEQAAAPYSGKRTRAGAGVPAAGSSAHFALEPPPKKTCRTPVDKVALSTALRHRHVPAAGPHERPRARGRSALPLAVPWPWQCLFSWLRAPC
jgi:hypothetical protein